MLYNLITFWNFKKLKLNILLFNKRSSSLWAMTQSDELRSYKNAIGKTHGALPQTP